MVESFFQSERHLKCNSLAPAGATGCKESPFSSNSKANLGSSIIFGHTNPSTDHFGQVSFKQRSEGCADDAVTWVESTCKDSSEISKPSITATLTSLGVLTTPLRLWLIAAIWCQCQTPMIQENLSILSVIFRFTNHMLIHPEANTEKHFPGPLKHV